MTDEAALAARAAELVGSLAAAGKVATTAESCTGGWIAKALTDVPGSSAVFGYGAVSYSNDAKQALLGVSEQTLATDGAVSEATVREMVGGALDVSGADLGVAVSGIAGPDGGSADKPVGTVWFAWGMRDGDAVSIDCERHVFAGDRDSVRRQTVLKALDGLGDRLNA
ncbi:MAG: nicotinamide-nucleotide amidohydrolase family protein [Woeseiaceae bacterium]|nr:nicotinamide-nucleotide amidohydrolase family protein [Woeseiaceae bacterium]